GAGPGQVRFPDGLARLKTRLGVRQWQRGALQQSPMVPSSHGVRRTVSVCGAVKIIDVVRNHRRAHNFLTTIIRLSGSQLHAACVLGGLSREEVAERAGLCRHSISKWETSSDAVPRATYSHLCRALDVLEGEGARFSGDGVSGIIRRLAQ